MKHTWHNTPGSKQHWLYKGTLSGALHTGVLGMIYEVNPTAFTVYKEMRHQPWQQANREFITQVETLEEAQGLLLTLVNSRIGANV
jgi:hypothetical protein